ncbi:hypothetical protein ASPZODRAFT_169958 [Penicilliopsis zonata CBS 506.65]|uniref:Mitochondrial division protein 1 n=1 Tax=Penicilliopsis zonata CBS 506.65 TaxID=1073090 RepID=A0A1L9S674_9EURO|nr:hypothetical protein ASPZODRAFT_169958 [Penicilliopsis zonata CBS 506.65]OJJ42671.1 hypothetical protein ASPZODRAFT_169958 [Penicilliopsis zonata CBS 506.65]
MRNTKKSIQNFIRRDSPKPKDEKQELLPGSGHLNPQNTSGVSIATPTVPEKHADESATPKGLWAEAYAKVEDEDAKLLEVYKQYLLSPEESTTGSGKSPEAQKPSSSPPDDRADRQLQDLAQRKLKAVHEGHRKIIVQGKKVVIKDQINRVIRTILASKDFISTLLSSEPHASLAWAGVVLILPVLSSPLTQADDATNLLAYVSELLIRMQVIDQTHNLSGMQTTKSDTNPEILQRLREKAVQLYARIIKSQMKIICQYSRSPWFRYWRGLINANNWKADLDDMTQAKQSIDEDLQAIGARVLGNVDAAVSQLQDKADSIIRELGNITEDLHIEKLSRARFAGFNAVEPSAPLPAKCLEGTRVEILNDLEQWGKENDDKPIFWLSGMAGTGKSTISRTICQRFNEHNLLGASFFFSRNGELRNHSAALFTTLASQLADSLPALREYMSKAIDIDKTISEQSPKSQCERLILEPLSELDKKLLLPLQIVIVLDALDECQDHSQHAIPELLSNVSGFNSIHLRTLIVSRPEESIARDFQKITTTYQHWKLDSNEQRTQTTRDVSLFLNKMLATIAFNRDLPPEWPGEEFKQNMVQKAGRLFIYAATVCRFLDTDFPEEQIESLMSMDSTKDSPTADLDRIYTLLLQQKITSPFKPLFQSIVGSVILLNESLSPRDLSMLLDIPLRKVRKTLDCLRSVLVVPEDDGSPVSLFHLSFHDFLLDSTRCSDLQFHVKAEEGHNRLFICSLNLMNKHLIKDICQLKHPGALQKEVESSVVEKYLPLAVQYACLFWTSHLESSKVKLEDDDIVHDFLKCNFLHWLEALTLMGKIFEGIDNILLLETLVKAVENPLLHAFIYDAIRWVLHMRTVIEEAPLQIYCSGLIFAPRASIIKQTFQSNIPAWLKEPPLVDDDWSPIDQSWPTDRHVIAFVVSDDASGRQRMRLEDVVAAEFLERDSRLATLHRNGDISQWDLTTGKILQQFRSNKGRFEAYRFDHVAFARNGTMVLSSFDDPNRGKIFLVDLASEKTLELVTGSSTEPSKVTISQNGAFVAAWSVLEMSIYIWHVAEQKSGLVPLDQWTCDSEYTHSDPNVIKLSSDGSKLASGHQDGTLLLWDTATRKVNRHLLSGDRGDDIIDIIFSPDDIKLVSLSLSTTVEVLDIQSGNIMQAFQSYSPDYSQYIWGINILPDDRIVTGSSDGSIIIRKLADSKEAPIHLTPRQTVLKIVVSANAATIGIQYSNETLAAWRIGEGRGIDVQFPVYSMALSPDGTMLAAGSDKGMIQIWDTATGAVVSRFRGYMGIARGIAFSQDSLTYIGSIDDIFDEGSIIKVWSIAKLAEEFSSSTSDYDHSCQTGPISPAEWERCIEGEVWKIAVSRDGKRLAAAFAYEICVFDVFTEKEELVINHEYWGIYSLAFHPNQENAMLAVGYSTGVALFNASTGQLVRNIECHWSYVDAIDSLPLGRQPAVCYDIKDGAWLIRNGERILYLPFDYRVEWKEPYCFHDNHVFIGTKERGLIRLHFLDDLNLTL